MTPRPLQNRVTPSGEIVACAARGLLMGNRGGRLHRDDRTLGPRRWTSVTWIACRLDVRDRRRAVMGAGYTELFFLDESTALSAGHRPCFECRRADALAFRNAWRIAHGLADDPRAAAIDRVLHAERRASGGRVEMAPLDALPDGAMIDEAGAPWLVLGDRLLHWTPDGYAEPRPRGTGRAVALLTPPSICRTLAAGYGARIHPSACGV